MIASFGIIDDVIDVGCEIEMFINDNAQVSNRRAPVYWGVMDFEFRGILDVLVGEEGGRSFGV